MTVQTIENIKFITAGDGGLVVDFSHLPADDALVNARRLGQKITQTATLEDGIRDVVPGLCNLLIQYDPLLTSQSEVKSKVLGQLAGGDAGDDGASRLWHIPVCYGGEYGPDLEEVAKATGLSPDDVIAKHTSKRLTVAIMGFLPGLGYMKGVDDALYQPRKSTPRQHVPARSVGIAMDQSVIYPLPSPGGWNLLGRTPVALFDPKREQPVLLAAGDFVEFSAIDEDAFKKLEKAMANGDELITPVPLGEGAS